jgi:hypothetical protein
VEDQDRPAVKTWSGGWLISPQFDLLFVANLGWLLLLLPGFSTSSGTPIDFWQVYFITLPHRWITLIVVALDPDRRGQKTFTLGSIALLLALIVFGIYFGTGGLLCLAIVDFAWNAWHFAAQHSGILRMYGLKAAAAPSTIERWGLRLFITYAILRTASWATGWAVGNSQWEQAIQLADFAMLSLPMLVLAQAIASGKWTLGRACYLLSVLTLYSGMLLATTCQLKNWLVPLLVASSLFHATEYLAIVTIYAGKRESVGTAGPFRHLATHWLGFLAIYIVSLGTLGVSLELAGFSPIWQTINVWAALVHYAFDGFIWKLRVSSTAQALGATP